MALVAPVVGMAMVEEVETAVLRRVIRILA
jgi:hypothetical protein